MGAALAGMRPVVDMHFVDFITVAMDEVVNQMAKIRYMFGGQCTVPIVLRAPDGITRSAAAQHSQSLEAWFMHVPGLKVVIPSNPADAKGLLKSAIRADDPVLYFEHMPCSRKGTSPGGRRSSGAYWQSIGGPERQRYYDCFYSLMMQRALEAADMLASQGIEAEVVDLRTISPLDKETIFSSVAKTKRLVIVHESVKVGGVGAEVAASVAEEMIDYLDAPIKRLGAPFVPIPFSPALERLVKISVDDIVRTVREICQ